MDFPEVCLMSRGTVALIYHFACTHAQGSEDVTLSPGKWLSGVIDFFFFLRE